MILKAVKFCKPEGSDITYSKCWKEKTANQDTLSSNVIIQIGRRDSFQTS